MRKIEGTAFIQIDTEGLAEHEIRVDLEDAGLKNMTLTLESVKEAEGLPDKWFEDFSFVFEFSGELDGDINDFVSKSSYLDEYETVA